jgi:hypothetical protein
VRNRLLVVIGVLALTASASGQNQFERQVRAQLEKVGERLSKQGFELTTQVRVGELSQERNEEVSVRLRGGVKYAIVGVCDQDCDDFDIVLYNALGREVAADTGHDDIPVVEVTPEREGTFTARAVMTSCKNDPCAYGLGLFSTGVDRFERQVREQLNQAAGRLRRDGYELTHHIYTGELEENQEENVAVELDRARTYVILGVCDADCKDLDLRLLTPAGKEVDADVEVDDYPTVGVAPTRREKYSVRAIMATCAAAPCRYGFGVFAR